MTGDLTIVGYFQDGELILDPSGVEGRSNEFSGIEVVVNRPRPAMCISNAFLSSGGVTLNGLDCSDGDGVIPSAPGKPNWGTLSVAKNTDGTITVAYGIGETDPDGKTNRYKLSTDQAILVESHPGTWPNGTGDPADPATYTVTLATGAAWSLVQRKPGNVNTTLTSQVETTITFTEKVVQE